MHLWSTNNQLHVLYHENLKVIYMEIQKIRFTMVSRDKKRYVNFNELQTHLSDRKIVVLRQRTTKAIICDIKPQKSLRRK